MRGAAHALPHRPPGAPPAAPAPRGPAAAPRPGPRPSHARRAAVPTSRAAAGGGGTGPREVAVLGGEDYIYSQRSGVKEELFKGQLLGVDADVAQGGFRQTELQSLAVSAGGGGGIGGGGGGGAIAVPNRGGLRKCPGRGIPGRRSCRAAR